MKRYAHDPRWITARYPATCQQCGKPIKQGDRAFYFPNGKALFCDGPNCGQQESANFDAYTFDEAFYNRETL